MFVFYAKKISILLFAASIFIIFTAGIYLFAFQSQPVFKQKTPIMHGNTAKKCVSLTVNVDWGAEYLPEMLSVLKQRDVKAIFFITGRWAQANEQLVKQITLEGHDIGNHGFSHPRVNNLSLEDNLSEIRQAEEILYQLTNKHTKFYAPPYGEYNETVVAAACKMNLDTVLWSIDTVDWQNPSPEWIISRISSMAHNGAIILMHPTPVIVKALPGILNTLHEQGYQITSLEKLLAE